MSRTMPLSELLPDVAGVPAGWRSPDWCWTAAR